MSIRITTQRYDVYAIEIAQTNGPLVEEETFTGTNQGVAYIAQLDASPFNVPTIEVVFDGTSYTASAYVSGDGVSYGAVIDEDAGTIDWSDYPFIIAGAGPMIGVQDGNQHTVSITAAKTRPCPAVYIEGSFDDNVDYEALMALTTIDGSPIATGSQMTGVDYGEVYLFSESANTWVYQFTLQNNG